MFTNPPAPMAVTRGGQKQHHPNGSDGEQNSNSKDSKKSNDTNNNVRISLFDARNIDGGGDSDDAEQTATAVGARRGDNERKNEWDAHDDSVLICSRLGALLNQMATRSSMLRVAFLRNVAKSNDSKVDKHNRKAESIAVERTLEVSSETRVVYEQKVHEER